MRARTVILACFLLCGHATAEPAKYAVDGLVLGTQLNFESASYGEYRCSPSAQFDGLTWCQRAGRGRSSDATIYSLLHSRQGSVLYINRSQELAFFNQKKADEYIQQSSSNIGESPRLMKMPHRSGRGDGIIAVWGKVTLEQLDSESVKVLAERKGLKKGLLIDFLGNFARSAKLGLPVYRIDGGPGFVWAASFDQKGRGILRLAAVDASKFLNLSVGQQPKAVMIGATSEASEVPEPELRQNIEKIQPELAAVTAPIVDPEKAEADRTHTEDDRITERTNLELGGAPLEAKSIISDASTSWWETAAFGSIAGLLVALITSAVVIYMKRQNASGSKREPFLHSTNAIEATAAPAIVNALSPDEALDRIEKIRRSLLLELASSPSLAPSHRPMTTRMPFEDAEPRSLEKLLEPV